MTIDTNLNLSPLPPPPGALTGQGINMCVRGCYLECLTVDRERESQVCVYSPVARYKVVASSRSVLVNEETIISSMC